MHSGFRVVALLMVAGMALLLSSCGNDRKAVYPTKGQVVDKAGKPAAGVAVILHPSADPNDTRHKPAGTTDAQGNFILTTYTENDGAPAGDYLITLEWRPIQKSPLAPELPDRLGGKFRDPKTSPYKATVNKGQNDLPAIQLP